MAIDPDKPPEPSATVSFWLSRIESARTSDEMTRWDKRCDIIRKQYKYENSSEAKTRRYQMLWSNLETMGPAIYSKRPKPEVIRRWNDQDRTARQASLMLERCIDYTLDENDFDSVFEQVKKDYQLYARGVARLYYEPVMTVVEGDDDDLDGSDVEGPQPEADRLADEASEGGDPTEVLTFENVKIKFVQRGDFVHEAARTWKEVNWIAFRAFESRDDLIERFGPDIGKKINLDSKPTREATSSTADTSGAIENKATIWEIWDRTNRKVLWVTPSYPEVLEESAPYLQLSGFYPVPRPAYGTITNESLEPVPDYIMYQDQCEEIDRLTARISALTDSLKLVGFYAAGPEGEGTPAIERAVKPGIENVMIAVKNFDAFKSGGGASAGIVWLPVEQVIKVLEGCVKMRQQLIDDVYQIFGLSDIMRGDGNASETATAQNIKAQYGSVRIRSRQQELTRFARDVCRMVGEIISAHFQPETIMAMSNCPLPTDAEILQQQMQAQEQALIAQAQQPPAQLMGHNGGPPMGQPMPQAAA